MKKMLFAFLCLLWPLASMAIELGDPAPALNLQTWIKGDPVELKSGSIFVVEFWATWCAPCKESIPHLSDLQRKFKGKDVVVVGISTEPAKDVKPFVEKMGSRMDYAVAVDTSEKTSAAYMGAFGIEGIPEAFVVDKKGRLVWHGDPRANLEEVLAQVVDGTYDLDHARNLARTDKLQEEYFKLVSNPTQSPRADELGNQIVTNLIKSPHQLNDFAWRILSERTIRQRNLSLALHASKSAYESTQGKSASVTETYARALFENGQVEEAIKYQQQAVDTVDKIELKAEFDNTLNKYKRILREKGKQGPKR